RYLERVRASLRGLPQPEAEEILLELRGHIVERVRSTHDVAAALGALGDPVEIAREYRNEGALARGECSNSPLVILHGLVLLRRRSWAGWGALALAALGYAWAIALAAASVEKFLSPREVGLWRPASGSFPRIIVDGAAPTGSRELLGWWFVPAAAAAFA